MAGTEWPCTADQIIHQRDKLRQSWKDVAIALELGVGKKNRGRYAQHAYEELTGQSRHDSRPLGGRGPKSENVRTNGDGTTALKRRHVRWHDDSDQDEIEAALLGERLVDDKGRVLWIPVLITAEHDTLGYGWTEEIPVRYATAFSYGPEGDQSLQVSVVENSTGATRTMFVGSISRVVK